MEGEREEEESIGTGEATVIILSHGCIQEGNYVDIPACVKDFTKKNTTACGYYGMYDTAFMKQAGELLYEIDGDIDNPVEYPPKGLETSFPQIQDMRRMRVKEEQKVKPWLPRGWQSHRFGDASMTGDCSNGVCVTHSKRKLINKIYEHINDDGKKLPLFFCYGKQSCANLFDPTHVLAMIEDIQRIS